MSILYEMLYIIDASLEESDLKAHQSDVKSIISNHSGEVKKENIWGRRRLAYPIRKKSDGYYVDLEFTGSPELPGELRDFFHTKPTILRHLCLRVPKAKLIQEKRNLEMQKRREAQIEKERREAAEREARREAEAAKAAEEKAAEEASASENTEATPVPVAAAAPTPAAPEAAPVATEEKAPAPAAEVPAAEPAENKPAEEPKPAE